MREAIATIYKSLNSAPLNSKDYELFSSQEECLKKINDALNIFKLGFESMNYQCEHLLNSPRPKQQTEQIRRLAEKVRDEWQDVNRSYSDRYNRWVRCVEKWKDLHNICWTFSECLDKLEDAMKKLETEANSKVRLSELEQEIPRLQKNMNNVSALSADIISRSSPDNAKELQTMVDDLKRRWQTLLSNVNGYRERSFYFFLSFLIFFFQFFCLFF